MPARDTIDRRRGRAERLDWPAFLRRFRRRFDQGDHITILGGPNAGKTHLSVLVAECRAFSFFIATKPRDPLIAKLAARGWHIASELDDALQLNDEKSGPLFPRFVYWPFPIPAERATLEEQAEIKAVAIKAAFIQLQRMGSWATVLDELNYLTGTLRLRRELEEFWHTARSNRISLLGSAQRPSWVPRAAVDTPSHIFVFQASDREELRRLGEITGGFDWRELAEEISALKWRQHEFLYVAPHDRVLLKSIAPPW